MLIYNAFASRMSFLQLSTCRSPRNLRVEIGIGAEADVNMKLDKVEQL